MKTPIFAISLAALALAGLPLQMAAADAEKLYKEHCAGCHAGKPPVVTDKGRAAQSIRKGLPDRGMPAFGALLSAVDIHTLVTLLHSGALDPGTQQAADTVSAAGHSFRVQPVASASGELWAMDFLPDGTLIATQKDGQLWLFRNGERHGPVTGIPEVKYKGQGGLLGVTVHPDYAENGWIYLTYSKPGKGGAMTAVARGRLDGLRWVDHQDIYTAPEQFHSDAGHHFGSRLVVRDGYIYFSVGDRGQMENAQQTGDPRGKIHRLHEDGRIPQDNPFAKSGGAASVWSYGHRNPQGMALQPETNTLWAAEHGPRGGDEINLIQRGRNYGWPRVTFGIDYDGSTISEHTQMEGMEAPKHHWTPSIAVSGIDFYRGDKFPAWRNQLLAASLAAQELHLLRIDGDKVVDDRKLLDKASGRIRDVKSGPDGYPYLLIGSDVFRLEPLQG